MVNLCTVLPRLERPRTIKLARSSSMGFTTHGDVPIKTRAIDEVVRFLICEIFLNENQFEKLLKGILDHLTLK